MYPMDLGTVRSNLESNAYLTVSAAAADARTVFSNCCTYNEEGTDYYSLGEAFSLRFEDMYAKIAAYEGGSKDASALEGAGGGGGGGAGGRNAKGAEAGTERGYGGIPTLEQKKLWAENLFKVSGDDLGQVVTMLDKKCPACLEAVTADEGGEPGCEINVDGVATEAFWEVDAFMKRSVAAAAGNNKRKR